MAAVYTYRIDEKAGTVEILMDGCHVLSSVCSTIVRVATNPCYRIRKRAEAGEAYCLALLVCADELMERGLADRAAAPDF